MRRAKKAAAQKLAVAPVVNALTESTVPTLTKDEAIRAQLTTRCQDWEKGGSQSQIMFL